MMDRVLVTFPLTVRPAKIGNEVRHGDGVGTISAWNVGTFERLAVVKLAGAFDADEAERMRGVVWPDVTPPRHVNVERCG